MTWELAAASAAVCIPSGIVGGVAGGVAGGAVGGITGIATGNKELGKQVLNDKSILVFSSFSYYGIQVGAVTGGVAGGAAGAVTGAAILTPAPYIGGVVGGCAGAGTGFKAGKEGAGFVCEFADH